MKIYGIWADGGISLGSGFVDDCYFLSKEEAEAELARRFPQKPGDWFSWRVEPIEVKGESFDWKLALAWYMFHVKHVEGVTFVRKGNGMSCMPSEFKAALQQVEREMEEMSDDNGWMTKPDGSVW